MFTADCNDPLRDDFSPAFLRRICGNHQCAFIGMGTALLAGSALSAGAGLLGSSMSSDAMSSAANKSTALQSDIALNNAKNAGPYLGLGAGGVASLSNLYGMNFGGYNDNGVVIPVVSPTGNGYSPGAGAPSSTSGGDVYFRGTGLPDAYSPNGGTWAFSGPSSAPTTFASPGSWANAGVAASGYASPLDSALRNFRGSPDYSFLRREGLRSLGQSEAAMGTYGSPTQSRDAIQYGMGLADTDYQQYFNNVLGANSQQNNEYENYLSDLMKVHSATQSDYQNYFSNAFNINQANQQNYTGYFNRLASLAGVGQTATNNLGTLSTTAGSNIGNSIMLGGQAIGAGYVGGANAVAGAGNNLSMYGLLQSRNNPAAYGSAYGGGNNGGGMFGGFGGALAGNYAPGSGAGYGIGTNLMTGATSDVAGSGVPAPGFATSQLFS